MKIPARFLMLGLGCGVPFLTPALAQDVTFVPGPASGYVAPASAPPQATVNSAGLGAGTQQLLPGTTKRTLNWNATASPTLANGAFADTFGTMISDTGTTVGYGVSGTKTQPLRWEVNGDLTLLSTLAARPSDGSIESKVTAVNPAGLAVGYSQVYDAGNTLLGTRALTWAAGATSATELPLASTNEGFGVAQAKVISDGGVIAGDGQLYTAGVTVGQRGIRWSNNNATATTLETLNLDAGGVGFAEVKAVNDAGTVAGNARKYSAAGASLGLRAVRWDAGSSVPTELGVLGSTAAGANVDTTAIGIDVAGNIAGLSQKYVEGATKGTRPVVWKAGTTTPVELPISGVDATGSARGNMSAMNKFGFIAGTIGTFSETNVSIGRRAIVWGVNGEIYNLNNMIPADSGWTLTVATDISDTGWVVGYGTYDADGTGPGAAVDRYFSLHSALFIAKPDIRVVVAENTLEDGVSTVAFGDAAVGFTTVEKTFTLHNDGTAPLNITSVSVTGDNSADFTVNSSAMTTPVLANGSTTFTVTFNPAAIGGRSATVKIASSDMEESTFDVALTGTGLPPAPGAIAFGYADVAVHEKVMTLNVPVTRTGGDNGAVSVRVNSAVGTATQADFIAVSDVVVNFAAGDSATKSVPVTIVSDALVEPAESFTLTLSDATGGATLGTPQVVSILIRASDTVKPTLAITTPTANQVISSTTGSIVTVTGTAEDDNQVEKVQVSLNGEDYEDAVLTPAAPGFTWSYDVTPVGGLNNLVVRVLDMDDNVTSLTRSFTYKKLSPLTVTVVGSGKVTGQLTGTVYEVGKKYTLTATPAANQAFDGWVGAGLTAPANEVAKLSFTFTDALFANPTITASFVVKPFIATEVGPFNGLVTPRGTTVPSNGTQGLLNLTLTATGSFSGKLKMDGSTLSVSGLFTNDGEARFGATRTSTLLVERANKPSLELANVQWDAATDTITGVINQYLRRTLTAESNFTLERAAFSARAPVSPAGITANGGKYTVIIPTRAQANGLLPMDYPQGTGIGLITITAAGNVSFVGTLADGTAISSSAPLSSNLKAPLFAQLYANRGSYGALVVLNSGPNPEQADSDLKAVNTSWFRPFQNKVQHYPWGWDEGLTLDLLGAKYTPGNNVIPGLPAVSPNGNATLEFSNGLLADPVTKTLNISATNAVTQIADTTSMPYTLTLTATTGDIKGTFTHTNSSKPAFKGKVYQKGGYTGAHGFFLTTTPKPIDGAGESGRVKLSAKVIE